MLTRQSHRLLIAGLVATFTLLLAVGLYLTRQGIAPLETRQPPQVVATLPEGSGRVRRSTTIEISFDQQMNRPSVENAFVMTPSVPGAFDWAEEGRGERLIFRPAQALAWDTTYEVAMGVGALNVANKPITQSLTLRFETGGQVAVNTVLPEPGAQEVDPQAPITIRFDRPLVEVTSLEEQSDMPQPISLDPPITGFGRWLAPNLFGYYPSERLAPGTTYQVTVGPEVAGAMELLAPYSWRFTTMGTQIATASPYPGQNEVALATRISLTFNDPIDPAGVERNFRIYPEDDPTREVAGEFRWEDDQTLVFVPSEALQVATTYRVEVRENAGSPGAAKTLNAPYQASFTTVDFLAVESTQPAPDTMQISTRPTETVIAVQFNHPVVALTGMGQQTDLSPITIQPPLAGEGRWRTTSLYTFTPSQPLLPSTEYKISVNAGLTDTVGSVLREAYTWRFTTTYPEVLRVEPADQRTTIRPDAAIRVVFNQAMDQASTERAFSLTSADGEVVAGRFIWPSPDTLAFEADQPLVRGAEYTARLAAGAKGATGGELDEATEQAFTVAPPPQVATSRPNQGAQNVEPYTALQIDFNVPMQQVGIEEHITLVPTATRIYTSWDPEGKTLYLSIPGELVASTNYTLTVAADTPDATGQQLGEPFTLHFTTGPRPPMLMLNTLNANRLGTFSPYTKTLVVFTQRNVEQVDLGLYRLDRETFMSLVGPNGWELWDNFRPESGDRVSSWSMPIDIGANRTTYHKTLVPPQSGTMEPGIYYLELAGQLSPAGEQAAAYAPSPGAYRARMMMIVSPINLTLKTSPTEALIWATDLQSGEPVPDLTVELVTMKGERVASGKTDAEGLFRTEMERPEDPYAPFFAFALDEAGEAATAVVSTQWNDSIGPWLNGINTDTNPVYTRAAIYTERPLYRPGQRVYFKGIVRADNDAAYALPRRESLEIRVRNPQGEEILTQEVSMTPFGTFHGEIELPDDAMLGFYEVFFTEPFPNPENGSFTYSGYFQVAEYRRPEFEVSVETDKLAVVQGTPLNATVSASYYAGGALSNADVTWRLLAQPYYFAPDPAVTGGGWWQWRDVDSDQFGETASSFNKSLTEKRSGLDLTGRTSWRIDTDLAKVPESQGSQRFTVEAEVSDLNNQAVVGSMETVVHQGGFYIGLRPDSYVSSEGEATAVNVLVLDTGQQPVANQRVDLAVYSREWYSVQEEREGGYFVWVSRFSDTLVTREEVQTDADGRAQASFTLDVAGSYTVLATAQDSEGREVRSRSYLWVSGDDFVAWRQENTDIVELVADKREYAPGDEARILVPMPYAGMTALVTFERGSIKDAQVITLDSNSETLSIPIKPEYAPNIYVSVLAIKGESTETPLPQMRSGTINLPVSAEQQQLQVSITPETQDDAPLKPGEVVTFTVRTTDYQGQPVSAEVSLAMVDKALLALARSNPAITTLTLAETFYGIRPLAVQTGSGLVINVDRISERLAPDAKGGGGGGGGGAMEIRQDFPETALWEPTLVTDEQGEAQLAVQLPDNLTTWTLTARGVTGESTLVGEQTRDLVSTKPLFVRPALPRFGVVGDAFELVNVIHNTTPTDLEVTLTAQALGLTLGKGEETVTVPAGGRLSVVIPATVETTDVAQVTISVEAPGHSDVVRQEFPVYQASVPETVATSGQVRQGAGAAVESIQLPPQVDETKGALTVEIAPSLAGVAGEALDYLTHYPYESVEQVVSTFLPNIVTLRALETAKLSRPELGEPLRLEVSVGVQKLLGMQNTDGGWGWWPGEESLPFLTGYTLLGLHTASEAGFAVPERTTADAQRWINRWLSRTADQEDNATLDTRAFLLYVLSRTGATDTGRTIKLFEQRQLLGNDGRAFLALALMTIEGDEGQSRAQTIVADFTGQAILSATGAHWEEQTPDRQAMDSTLRSTALVLQAMLATEPENLLVAQAVRWLLAARTPQLLPPPPGATEQQPVLSGVWESTQATAWSIMALTDYMLQSGELEANFGYEIALNNDVVHSETVGRDNVTEREQLRFAIDTLLLDEANRLVVTRTPPTGAQTGAGRLYYAAWLQYYLSGNDLPAVNEGVSVSREYVAVDPATLRSTGATVEEVAVGQVVQVKLTVVAPNDLYFFALEDPLPAGFEAIDPSLATSSGAADTPQVSVVEGGQSPFFYAGWSSAQLRDEKVALFAQTLPRGTYEYTYLARASVAGTFSALPTTGYEMYHPEVFGRSTGHFVTVTNE